MSSWDLIFVLPNLSLGRRSPFLSTSAAIVGAAQARTMVADSAANRTGLQMLERFSTAHGEPVPCSCLVVRQDALGARPHADALQAFRNACAVAAVVSCKAKQLAAPAGCQGVVDHSDAFDFYYLAPTTDGAALGALPHGVQGERPLLGFRGQCDPRLGSANRFDVTVDEKLLGRLLACWEMRFIERSDNEALIRVGRSITAAFHAARVPADGVVTIEDRGFRLGLWVTAFECLLHPGSADIIKEGVVLKFLKDGMSWRVKELAKQDREVVLGGAKLKKPAAGKNEKASWPQQIYDDLYTARCASMHGEAVDGDLLFAARSSSKGVYLGHLAAALFACVLRDFIDKRAPAAAPAPATGDAGQRTAGRSASARRTMERLKDGRTFEDALTAARVSIDDVRS